MKAGLRQLLMGGRPRGTNVATRMYSINSATAAASALYSGFTITAGSQMTAHVGLETETDFDAVRVILLNHSTSATLTVAGATATVGATLTTDALNNTAFDTPSTFTFSGAAGGTVPVGTQPGSIILDGVLMSDWLELRSIPRTDIVGARPALYIRVLFTFPGGATDTVTFWNRGGSDWTTARTNAKGAFLSGHNQGDHLTGALGGGGAFAAGNSAIFGVQYRARGKAMTVIFPGDSIGAGSSLTTRLARPWNVQAAMDASTRAKPIEFINCGLPGKQPTLYGEVAAYLMKTFSPTHAMFSGFSPNVVTTTISVANVDTMRANLGTFLLNCQNNIQNGGATQVIPGISSGVPRNSSSAPNTAAYWDSTNDARRRAWIAEMRAYGLAFADINAAIGDDGDPQLIQMTGNGDATDYVGSDGLHPNDAGDAAMETAATATLAAWAQRYYG